MHYFFYISWFTQLLTGIALFSVSLHIQYTVLQLFFNNTLISVSITIILETAKINTIIWHRFYTNQYNAAYSVSVRWASSLFKAGLFGLSLIFSIVYLSDRLTGLDHEIIAPYIQLIKPIIDGQTQASAFIYMFSILISMLIELGTLLAFESLTVSNHTLMQKQQQFELDKQVLKVQVRSQQDVQNIKHEADIELIKKASKRAVSKAKIKILP